MKKTHLIDYGVTCVIMGGGAGTRLAPLTQLRAKPAVPVAGKFRLIDIPISNCINSGFTHIFILTQFNSTPLHRHISQSYQFDRFTRGFVEILAAQQSPGYPMQSAWYQGTADAVRKNLARFRDAGGEDVLILSGDQIYQMDLRDILETHYGRGDAPKADVTIGTVLVPQEKTSSLGILSTDSEGRVQAFIEKPKPDEGLYPGLEVSEELLSVFDIDTPPEPLYMGNMGIYVFGVDMLEKALDNDYSDFGKEVLPALLDRSLVRAHLYQGYWEDIGTIRAFHRANIDLAREDASFDFYDQANPVYTRARHIPAARMQNVTLRRSLIADGCLVNEAEVEDSIIGLRAVIGRRCRVHRCYVMGADDYETHEDREENRRLGRPDIGIGDGSVIQDAIIDKDARVGRNVRIANDKGYSEYNDGRVIIRDGVATVTRGAVVPDGYSI